MKHRKANWNRLAAECGEAMTPAAHKSRLRRIKVNWKHGISHIKHGKVNSLCGKVNFKLDVSIRQPSVC